jgi:NADH-quinone oxidoreductase subunit N
MKYFVLGALASGMLLYGMSLVYGATGTLDLADLSPRRRAGRQPRPAAVRRGVHGRSGIGLQVRCCAVPHVGAGRLPGRADGPITLFIGSAPKLAAFGMAYRLLEGGARSAAIGARCWRSWRCCRW